MESDDPQIFTQDVSKLNIRTFLLDNRLIKMQLVLITAQKRAALGECEARHKEILDLEQNIRVSINLTQ